MTESKEFLMNRFRLFTKAFIAFLLIVSVPAAAAPPPKDVLVIASKIDDIVSLDPAEIFEFSGAEYAAQVYDRLIAYDLNDVSKIVPSVAESWTVSEDGKTFTFNIRRNVFFHSGNVLSAHDVVYSLRRVVHLNKTPAFILTQFGLTPDNVADRIEADGDFVVTFETDKAYAPSFVLYCLTANVASIVDSKEVKKREVNGDFGHLWLRRSSEGSGPFKLKQWRASESILYEKNPNYWKGKVNFNRVIVRHVAETSTQRLLVEKGDVDIARNISSDQIPALRENAELRVVERPRGEIMYLSMNVAREPFKEEAGRQAIKYLIDYDAIAGSILAGQVRVHQNFLPNGFLGAINDQPYALDVAKAKSLLAEAGFPEGYKITLDTRNLPELLKVAQALQASLGKAGIEVEIIPGDGQQVLTKYRARRHDLHLGSWGPDYQDPHTNAQTFAANPDPSESANLRTLAWRNNWATKSLTELTTTAVLERDSGKRAALYGDIQRQHLNSSPFAIMFQRIATIVERNNVQGMIYGPSFDTYFYWQGSKN